MMLDALLSFVPLGVPLSLVAGLGVDVPSPNVIDLMGDGVGTALQNIFGNSAVPGVADAHGIGSKRPELVIAIGTGLVTVTAATLNAQLQGAPDNGVGGAGAWSTFGESGPITAAQGVANAIIARLPWLPPWPFNQRPRFLRLNFEIPAATQFTAGTIGYALVTTSRDDIAQIYGARNYAMGPLA